MCVCVREDTHGELEGGWERKEDAAPDCNPVFFGVFLAFFVCLVFFSDLVMFTAVQSV